MSSFSQTPSSFNGTVGNRGGPQITDLRQYGIEKARYDSQVAQSRDNGDYKHATKGRKGKKSK